MGVPALPRLLTERLANALRSSPVVVLTGARQVGKSALARMVGESEGREYRTLDDFEILERARSEPEALVSGDAGDSTGGESATESPTRAG